MKDQTVATIDAYLDRHFPEALERALRSMLPELVHEAVAAAIAKLHPGDAGDLEYSLRRARDAAKELGPEIDELASRAYDIEYSLKKATSWASYLDDAGPGRRR